MSASTAARAAAVRPPAPHAVLDTDVYSLLYFAQPPGSTDPRVASWKAALTGFTVIIAAQTRGELGVALLGFQSARRRMLQATLDATLTAYPDQRVVQKFSELRFWAKNNGHPLQQKENRGDVWIAATAVVLNVPLLSGDKIFGTHGQVAGLRLL